MFLALLLSCAVPKQVNYLADYEDQLLQWCSDTNPWSPHEGAPTSCDSPETSQWDHYPLSVSADPGASQAVLEAIEAINYQSGVELLRLTAANEQPDVMVVVMGDALFVAGRAMRWTDAEGADRAGVAVYGEDYQGRADLMMHELGHVLGLRHDYGNRLSIMHESLGPKVMSLQHEDVKALRTMYYKVLRD